MNKNLFEIDNIGVFQSVVGDNYNIIIYNVKKVVNKA